MTEDNNIQIEKKKDSLFENKMRITINREDYCIRYNNNVDMVMLNAYLIKIINNKDKIIRIGKDNEFYIENVTELEKRVAFEKAIKNYIK